MRIGFRRVVASVVAAGAVAALVAAGVTPASAAGEPGDGGQPSLEEMNAARDHSLGSSLLPDRQAEALTAPLAATFPPGVPGLDVSAHQPSIDWADVAKRGAKFAYVKASEDVDYRSSTFTSQWNGARTAGLLTGAYHFATPNTSGGAAQAQWFLASGATWSADGRTLPPMLDVEANPYAKDNGLNECWGLTPAKMVQWVKDFTFAVENAIGRTPVIYTNTGWWNRCTAGSGDLGNYPLSIANWTGPTGKTPGTLPSGWPGFTFWQYQDDGYFPGDQQVFNGTLSQLRDFALNARVSGADRFGTSAALASAFAAPVSVAYVASGAAFPDALAGGPATKGAGPVLLIQPFAIPTAVATELRRLRPTTIVVLGGEASVTTATFNALKGYSGNVVRYYGADRYDTSAAVVSKAFPNHEKDVYIASGLNFPDALSGAALAAGLTPGPLLLTTPWGLTPSVVRELKRLRPDQIHIIGGPASVGSGVETQLRGYVSGAKSPAVVRVSGSDRFETSAAIAAEFPVGGTAYIANGLGFPDALSGAPVAGSTDSPVLLVQATAIPPSVKTQLQRLKPKRIVILGGEASVSASVAAQLQAYRVAG